jgi:hypothetical protein
MVSNAGSPGILACSPRVDVFLPNENEAQVLSDLLDLEGVPAQFSRHCGSLSTRLPGGVQAQLTLSEAMRALGVNRP